MSDIERHQLEYQAIFENAAVGITYTKNRTFGHCNERLAALLGYTPAELEGMPTISIYFSDAEFERISQLAGPLLGSGKAFETDWTYKRRDGSPVMCHIYARAVNPQNTDEGTVWVFVDITNVKAIEEAHQVASTEIQAIMENAAVAILFTRDRKITRYNPKFSELFAYPGNTAIGLGGRVLYCSDEDYAEIGRLAFPLLSQGRSFRHETTLQRADGTTFWGNLIGYLIEPANPAVGTIWMIEDRSDFKAAENALTENLAQLKATNQKLEEAQNQLLQSEKLASIGLLAAGVAHEINNPVGFVSSNLSTLTNYSKQLFTLINAYEKALGTVTLPAALTEELDAVREDTDLEFIREDVVALLDESADGIQRVRRIVQDLKDFSHVDSGEWKPVNLNNCLESTLNVIWNELKFKVKIERELAELPDVLCNAPQINQVMMNLLVNAGHAIESSGTIYIRTGSLGDESWFEIEDTGSGITEQVQKRIFEPFFTTKPIGQGTGLGLSVSYGIIAKHNGRIELDSVVGRGSRFRVWLPNDGPGENTE